MLARFKRLPAADHCHRVVQSPSQSGALAVGFPRHLCGLAPTAELQVLRREDCTHGCEMGACCAVPSITIMCRGKSLFTNFMQRRELSSNTFLIVRRGEHCHDNPGISSGRLWLPYHDFMARKCHAGTKKSSVDGLLAFFEIQGTSGPFPDRNRIPIGCATCRMSGLIRNWLLRNMWKLASEPLRSGARSTKQKIE